ncbi:TRAP-type C4-dicarboxylate transport system permease small subunit [Litoreibacter halocynthiae]|uniref:TRAP transporter small permease protein n=1 Tax=Litoreibacter halocynthiae TaxID=1242689 RepID=A0A4R7LN60_9RHOB|nr:TRAP transporter small permease [Litoreibacter halocynthiae]TDT77144.1 TRAP-type C4-dicarboxylate transport system permease small subunit [Litoreibacter halocynthiae]
MEKLRHRFPNQPPQDGGLDIGLLLNRTLGVGAAVILLVLALITCIDVIGRYFLDAPLSGAFEMTELLLAALVFMALPLTTERNEHVEVDLLNMALSPRSQRWLSAFAGLFSAALLATFSWRLFTHAYHSALDGAVTNALEIPLAPFGYLAGAACLLSAFIAFLRGVQPPFDHPGDEDHLEGAP